LGDLNNQITVVTEGGCCFLLHVEEVSEGCFIGEVSRKTAAVASNGEFWIARVLSTVQQLESDEKHVSRLAELDEEELALHAKSRETIANLKKVYCKRFCL